MPVEYEGVLKETLAVRKTCGIFDLCHMGEIEISGKNSLAFLQTITTNDIASIPLQTIQYNVACNEKGGILDDFMVYRRNDSYLCVVNASNAEKMRSWFLAHPHDGVTIKDNSLATALIALQGPLSEKILQHLTAAALSDIAYMSFCEGAVCEAPTIISRSGYTGEDGFELYCASGDAPRIWDALYAQGRQYGLVPCGLGARDILRLEMGYTLYGNEIDEHLNPIEAGLNWVIKYDAKDFIGKDALLKEKKHGPRRALISCVMRDRALPRHGYKVYSGEGKEMGFVTSGNFSPNADAFVARAYVDRAHAKIKTEIFIDVRGKRYAAEVVPLPFVPTHVKKTKKIQQ
jgi:aminomethyltransferase